MALTTEHLDAAWFLAKGAFAAESRGEVVKQLTERFPELSSDEIEEAVARAARLEDVSCECVEEIRGPMNDFTGSASRDVRVVCPGFSEAVYQDAHGWAMYLTK